MTFGEVVWALLEIVGLFVTLAVVIVAVAGLSGWAWECWQAHRARKLARIEAELDRKQEELRAVIYRIAEGLNEDARRAEAAMARQAEAMRPRNSSSGQ